jgi:hypothetical protein
MLTGLVLTALGVGFYFGTDRVSWTALIPAFFGVPLLVLGILALRERLLKHTMHAAAALGLIGFLGGAVMAVLGVAKSEGELGNATIEQGLLALVCAVFVGLCVRSFIVVRRNRARAQKG